jgi:hypothetical protein
MISDLPKSVIGNFAFPMLLRTLLNTLVQHAKRGFELAGENRFHIFNHGSSAKGPKSSTTLITQRSGLGLRRCPEQEICQIGLPSTAIFSKWRTTHLILNHFLVMTYAYPQSEFAKFQLWRTPKKNGGLYRPLLFSRLPNAQKN